MKNRTKKLSQVEILSILDCCQKQDEKKFTQTLKAFIQSMGGNYFSLKRPEAEQILHGCIDVFNQFSNPVVQYNALRLAKYAVDHPEALGQNYKEPWKIYLRTIFHSDGRVRMAGVHLLDRYYMALVFDFKPIFLSGRRKFDPVRAEKMSRFAVECFFHIQDIETEYLNEHQKLLRKTDLPDMNGGMPWASETKDKYLKSIRMGLEVFLIRGPFEDLMAEFGYHMKQSKEFPENVIFGRWVKKGCTICDAMLNAQGGFTQLDQQKRIPNESIDDQLDL